MRVATMIADDNITAWFAERVAVFSCLNLPLEASKQASKPLFIIKACFFPFLGIFSVIFSAYWAIVLPRNPLLDYRGIFLSQHSLTFSERVLK